MTGGSFMMMVQCDFVFTAERRCALCVDVPAR
jgi:hypothetical protein